MGMPAGELDEKGEYAVDTVNRRVSDELARLAKLQKEIVSETKKPGEPAGAGESATDAGKTN